MQVEGRRERVSAAVLFATGAAAVLAASGAGNLHVHGSAVLAAGLAGFSGAMIIVGTSQSGFAPAIGLGLVGALLQAGIHLILKSMTRGVATSTLVVWSLSLAVPISLSLAVAFFAMPGNWELVLLALQSVVGTSCMGLMTHALSIAPASIVAPIDFLRLPLVALGGSALFNESIALTTVVGAIPICLAALLAGRPQGVKASN